MNMDVQTTLARAGALDAEPLATDEQSAGPPCVTRGAKCATGVYLTLDWIRFVGPDTQTNQIRLWLIRRFGSRPEGIKGRHCCEHGEAFVEGITLMWGHRSEICIVEFNGAALAPLTAEERVEIIRELVSRGFRSSRIDIAADFVNQDMDLCDAAVQSCRANELCRARRFRPIEDRTATECHGKTVYLGLRGKEGSGRLGRVYDKGLETKTQPEGVWERFEVEYTKDTAKRVAEMIARAVDWSVAAAQLLLGAFDFREVNGRRHIDDRPRAAWWERVIGLVQTVRIRLSRPPAELHRFAMWTQRCVVPTLKALANVAGCDIDQLTRLLCDPNVLPREEKHGSVIQQFRRWKAENLPHVAT